MDVEVEPSAKAHLDVLNSRIASLQKELENALREEEEIEKEMTALTTKRKKFEGDCKQRLRELETDYNSKNQEYQKQVKLAIEVLEKKKEERHALLEYLANCNICDRLPDDVRNLDWESLKVMANGTEKADGLEVQRSKALLLADLNQKARVRLDAMSELFSKTVTAKSRISNRIQELREFANSWSSMAESQEKKMAKMHTENERLNLLIKQCALTNEPMSEYVTKNVRAKYQSFLNSSCPKELLNGLKKFRTRQDSVIKLLKHKESILNRDTNQLQVATDQTADQMQYYLNIIQSNRDVNMNLGPSTSVTITDH